ncbi:hypothetical protein ABFS83_04G226300 [Erythranthe nasuta]
MLSIERSHHGSHEGDIKVSPDNQEDDGGHWYFSKKEIEENSPSRQDGIDLKKETSMRNSYCKHLQDLGMKLQVPQVTIATAMIFCHRFFIYQSHAKNDRKTIATVCMFLAGKVEETPRPLKNVILTSYELIHKKDAKAVQKIKQKEVYEQQKELILIGEKMVLATLAFDLNVLHPYKPLVEAIKKFKVAQNALAQVAWNFVNDGLRTSLCLQFKPHHIAAGAIFLAAKFLKVKLPSDGDKVWWQEFDVTPRQLEVVSNQMLELYEQNRVLPSQTTKAEGGGGSQRPPSKGGHKEHLANDSCSRGGAPSRTLPSKHSDNHNGPCEVTQTRTTDYETTSETNYKIGDSEINSTEHHQGQTLSDKHHGRNLSHKDDTVVKSPQKIDREKLKAAYERRKASGDKIPQKMEPLDELEWELEDVELPEKIKPETKQSRSKHMKYESEIREEEEEEGEVEPFDDDDDDRGYISPRSSIRKRKAEQQNDYEREHKKHIQENHL